MLFLSLLPLSLAVSTCTGVTDSGKIDHVHLVDVVKGSGGASGQMNLLFRSGSPDTKDGVAFAYDQLLSQMREVAAAEGGVTIPDKCEIVDVNLLNVQQGENGDRGETQQEFDFFNKYAPSTPYKVGDLYHFWATFGTEANASDPTIDAAHRQYLVDTEPAWNMDQLSIRVAALQDMMGDFSWGVSKCIFFHCDCGCDRTGEMAAAYYLSSLPANTDHPDAWSTINAVNVKIPGRPWGCNNYLAAHWHCLWLEQIRGHSLGCDHGGECQGPNKTIIYQH